MNRPINVLGVIGEELTGVSYVRFVQPFEALQRHGYRLSTLGDRMTFRRRGTDWVPDERLLDDVDIVIFPQMVAAPVVGDRRIDLVEPLCQTARRRGIPVVWSVDDHVTAIEPTNAGFDRMSLAGANLQSLQRDADAIFVTTRTLGETLAGLGKPIHLLPNAVDPARWSRRSQRSDHLRFGWAGSASHLMDLVALLPAVRRLQRRLDARFVVCGITPGSLEGELNTAEAGRHELSAAQLERLDLLIELVSRLREVKYEHVGFRPLQEYFASLSDLGLDIGLCPLLDSPFNRARSALKFYEYAMVGSLSIASNVVPYRGEVSITVENDPGAWCECIEEWLRDAPMREDELARQRGYVLAHRSVEAVRPAWIEALESVIEGRGSSWTGAATDATDVVDEPYRVGDRSRSDTREVQA